MVTQGVEYKFTPRAAALAAALERVIERCKP
jgi:hypothetical protein